MESFATRNRIRGRRQWRIDLTACEGEAGQGTLSENKNKQSFENEKKDQTTSGRLYSMHKSKK